MNDLISREALLKQPLDTANYPSNYVREADAVPAIPIPDNATNGDVIKALFPSWKVEHVRKMSGMNRYECGIDSINHISFYDDWWNAPYKRGETE